MASSEDSLFFYVDWFQFRREELLKYVQSISLEEWTHYIAPSGRPVEQKEIYRGKHFEHPLVQEILRQSPIPLNTEEASFTWLRPFEKIPIHIDFPKKGQTQARPAVLIIPLSTPCAPVTFHHEDNSVFTEVSYSSPAIIETQVPHSVTNHLPIDRYTVNFTLWKTVDDYKKEFGWREEQTLAVF